MSAARDGDLCAELLGLDVGAIGELATRDAGRKAQVVLDPRARAGLSAGRPPLEHQHVESFRGSIDRGGKARRAGAHDDEIADVDAIDRVVEPEAVGDLLIRGIFQDQLATADQHGDVCRADVEAIEQHLRIGIAIEIDVGERMAVAGQEFACAQRAARMARADEDRVADPRRDELGAAQDERAHQDLAQLGVNLYQGDQLFTGELDHFAGVAYPDAEQRAPPRNQVRFAGELTLVGRNHDAFGRS